MDTQDKDVADRLVEALDKDWPDWLERHAHPQDTQELLRYAQRQPADFPRKLASVKRSVAFSLLHVLHVARRHGIKLEAL